MKKKEMIFKVVDFLLENNVDFMLTVEKDIDTCIDILQFPGLDLILFYDEKLFWANTKENRETDFDCIVTRVLSKIFEEQQDEDNN